MRVSNSLEFTLVMTYFGICTSTIFVPEQMLACITSNGLSVFVFPYTDGLAIWYSSVIRPVLNTAQLYCTTAWENISQKWLRRSRGELFALFIQWQRLCHTGWRCSMLSFRLFHLIRLRRMALYKSVLIDWLIGATNFAVIFFCKLLNPSNCIHHLLPPTRDTEITSRLRKATTYPRPRNRTNCYKSFIHHALIKYQ